jgi:hypothetical protein
MRLLHTEELRFEEFFDTEIPPYGILSHRWGEKELSYQMLNSVIELPISENEKLNHPKLPGPGLDKIRNFRQYTSTIWDWVWVDTCCINKESSSKLSEAINSMYRWYQNARCCYVYLSDVEWQTSEGIDEISRVSDKSDLR